MSGLASPQICGVNEGIILTGAGVTSDAGVDEIAGVTSDLRGECQRVFDAAGVTSDLRGESSG